MCVWQREKEKLFWPRVSSGMWFIFTVFTSLLAAYQSVNICVPTPETKSRCNQEKKKKRKTERENNKGERTDWMKSSTQTGVVTNREFYELQTCWNGVPCVCSGSYRLAGSEGRVRASTLALRKNGLIHFPHERVSLGRHQTSQSTQIYGPLKQQASWPPCHHRLAAEAHCTLIHARPLLSITGQLPSLFIPSSGPLLLPYMNSSHSL